MIMTSLSKSAFSTTNVGFRTSFNKYLQDIFLTIASEIMKVGQTKEQEMLQIDY